MKPLSFISKHAPPLLIRIPFAADYYHIKITSLRIEHLTVEMIIAFLNHLEQDRKNTARTRNLRLVAIKSLAR